MKLILAVIPAQAGISLPTPRDSAIEIPACAGMTDWKNFLIMIIRIFLILITVSITACAPKLVLERGSFNDVHNWRGDHMDALAAFNRSCEKILTLPGDHDLGIGGKASDWTRVCFEAPVYLNETKMDEKRASQFFENLFVPFKAYNHSDREGLFTGYYEPALWGSLNKSERFKYPLYKKPDDLIDGEEYLGRRRIEAGELDGKGLELVYVDDVVDLFFLQIQGSGRILLDDGRIMRVGYDGKNNCPYSSIGKQLIEEGELVKEEVTADSIKEWLRDNPERAQEIMHRNQSYVFFKTLTGDGPIGAQGVPLIPERSLAVDKEFIPYGVPIWLETTLPDVGEGEKEYHRLLIAQDTGGAIKGPVRGDVFFGYGDRAEKLAGHMKQPGEYYILLPGEVVQRKQEND